MPNILELPNELLLLILGSVASIQSAVYLSQANQRLRAIWLENVEAIAASVLKPWTPAYEDAMTFAITEIGYEKSVESSEVLAKEWIPRLQYNAELANSVSRKHEAWLRTLTPTDWRAKLQYGSREASYYVIRLLVLSFLHPELRPRLRARLKSEDEATLRTHIELCIFICMDMGDVEGGEIERARHDMPKPRKDWTMEDETNAVVNKDEWTFAGHECQHAWEVAYHGRCFLVEDLHECCQ